VEAGCDMKSRWWYNSWPNGSMLIIIRLVMSLQIRLVSALMKVESDPFSKNVRLLIVRTPTLSSNWAMRRNDQRLRKREEIRWHSMSSSLSTLKITSSK
jgi:hypothetical protein